MTISDIAKMAGVSSAAVSRYLNGGPLSEQKREAIREVVEKTGYRPDAAAQTLRTGRVNQIGVIAPSISSQSVGQITAGIASELDQQNYLILLGNTELDEQRELGYLTAMQRNHVAGIILLGCYYSPQLARAFKACRVPLVVTGQRFPEVPCCTTMIAVRPGSWPSGCWPAGTAGWRTSAARSGIRPSGLRAVRVCRTP